MKTWSLILTLSQGLSWHMVQTQAPQQPPELCVPNLFYLNNAKIALPFQSCAADVKKGLITPHPDEKRDTGQILQAYGYKYETHNVTTKDGYILKVRMSE